MLSWRNPVYCRTESNIVDLWINSACNVSESTITNAGIRNEALRVAFIHAEESEATDGSVVKEFYSKLVKADVRGKDQVYKRCTSCFCVNETIIFLM